MKKHKKTGRRVLIPNKRRLSLSFDSHLFEHIRHISEMYTQDYGTIVSTHEMIRCACKLVFEEGQWLRECFQLAKAPFTKQWIQSAKKR